MAYNVSIDCGLSAAHVSDCGFARIPEAIAYCVKHAWEYCSYDFEYTSKFWNCLKTLKIERVRKDVK